MLNLSEITFDSVFLLLNWDFGRSHLPLLMTVVGKMGKVNRTGYFTRPINVGKDIES